MIGALLTLFVYVLIIGLFLWLVQFVLARFPLPDPIGRVLWVLAVVIAVIAVILLLLDIAGNSIVRLPRFG